MTLLLVAEEVEQMAFYHIVKEIPVCSFASVYAAMLASWTGFSTMIICQTWEAQSKLFDRLPSPVDGLSVKCFTVHQRVACGS